MANEPGLLQPTEGRKPMKRLMLAAVLVFAVGFCIGCKSNMWQGPVQPPQGALVTSCKFPITANFKETPTDGEVSTVSTFYVRDPIFTGLDFAWDDASIQAATEKGDFDRVYYADGEIFTVLGIFGKFTVRVHGE